MLIKKALKYSTRGLAAIAILALAGWFWAYQVATSRYETRWTVHKADVPIPFPLGEDELAALRADRIAAGASAKDPLAGVDLKAVALERAIRQGRHIVESRAGCNGCHDNDFGGGSIIDLALVAHWVAPNLTSGEGSVTRGFTANDWARAVRHAVRHNGHTSSMPSVEAPSVELGQHIVQVCRACHGPQLSGGTMAGDPDMPIVANLTPHETGLKSWGGSDFIRALREDKRNDGTAISQMMPWKAYGQMSDTELKAVWAYLQTVPAVEKGNR